MPTLTPSGPAATAIPRPPFRASPPTAHRPSRRPKPPSSRRCRPRQPRAGPSAAEVSSFISFRQRRKGDGSADGDLDDVGRNQEVGQEVDPVRHHACLLSSPSAGRNGIELDRTLRAPCARLDRNGHRTRLDDASLLPYSLTLLSLFAGAAIFLWGPFERQDGFRRRKPRETRGEPSSVRSCGSRTSPRRLAPTQDPHKSKGAFSSIATALEGSRLRPQTGPSHTRSAP